MAKKKVTKKTSKKTVRKAKAPELKVRKIPTGMKVLSVLHYLGAVLFIFLGIVSIIGLVAMPASIDDITIPDGTDVADVQNAIDIANLVLPFMAIILPIMGIFFIFFPMSINIF